MGVAAMECPKVNRVPEAAARLDPAERVKWLKSPEAKEALSGSRRRQLKRRWLEDAEGSRTPGHEVVDPAAEKVRKEIAEVKSIARMRAEAPRGTVDGIAPCGCHFCFEQRAHWPGPYVDEGVRDRMDKQSKPSPRAYECHLEHNPPAEEEADPQPNRTYGDRVNKGDATRIGLTERSAKQRWADTLTDACEGCGRRKATGAGVSRYCMACRENVIEALAGWTPDKIRVFLDPRNKIK